MRTKESVRLLAIVVVSGVLPFWGSLAAQEAHGHGGVSHGGVEARTKRHHFEAVFTKSGVRLYVYGADHRSVDVSHLSGSATFYHASSPKPWFIHKLQPTAATAGQLPGSLDLPIDLGRVPTKGARVSFEVSGLPDPSEPTASFTVPFTLADDGSITVGRATRVDEKAIAAQRVCPVSGEELGEMGPPVKVTRGGRSIFLCCKNCLKQVQTDPDKFFTAPATEHAKAGHHHE